MMKSEFAKRIISSVDSRFPTGVTDIGVYRLDSRGLSYGQNVVRLPGGQMAPMWRESKRYRFDGQIWWYA